jgi:NAD+ diphosphatase
VRTLPSPALPPGPFTPLVTPPLDVARHRWYRVQGNSVLVTDDEPDSPAGVQFLGMLGDLACWATDDGPGPADRGPSPEGHLDLFSLHGRLADVEWFVAGRAVQLVEWARTHRFCGRCATPTERVDHERAMRCPSCGLLAFPRLAPAAIVVVERGRELLLARGVAFPPGLFSAIAGFVEPGETLEQAVVREVKEEVGVDVADVTYVASQPWPFPHSLMLGFRARWVGGDVVPEPTEIAETGWFPVDALPTVPPRISIARRLIDDAVERLA